MTWIVIIVVTAAINLVVADLADWLPRVAERIIRLAVHLLPTRDQARYEAEWVAELDALPGRGVSAVVFAFRLLVGARAVGRELVGWRESAAESKRTLSTLETAQAET